MLVCNVSLRPLRRAIAAGLVEAATAADATATGNVVFAALVDDPASATDTVNAFLGSIMVEAASASDTVTVSGGAIAALVDEPTTAGDVATVSSIYGVVLAEPATAVDVPDASTAAAAIYNVSVAEAASAADVVSVIASYAAVLSETATAADAPDATITSAATTTTVGEMNLGPWSVVTTDTVIDAGSL